MAARTATRYILLAFLVAALAVIIAPSASAAYCELKSACISGEEVAIASVSAPSNAHLTADNDSAMFGYRLCCNASINEDYYGTSEMFSVSNSGSSQGHVGENTTFSDAKVSGSWTQCSLRSSCLTTDGEACLIRVSGSDQGHVSSCDSSYGNNSLCCCPYGTQYVAGTGCIERASEVDVYSITGPDELLPGETGNYEVNVSWGWEQGINVTIWAHEIGDSTRINPAYFQLGEFTGDENFSYSQSFSQPGDYEICAHAIKKDGSQEDTHCESASTPGEPFTVSCIEGAYPGNTSASNGGQCCSDALWHASACWNNANINGTVVLYESDGSPNYVSNAEVNIYDNDVGLSYTDTTTGGEYSFTNIPGANYSMEVTYLSTYSAYNTTDATTGGNFTQDFSLSEQEYTSDCTNQRGRCDRDALGKNGCLVDPSAPNYTERRDTLYACDPEGSAGRQPGDLVFVDSNSTHRYQARCCAEVGEWTLAPKATIEGDVENLIKYTRLTTYLGQPVRLVIATWN